MDGTMSEVDEKNANLNDQSDNAIKSWLKENELFRRLVSWYKADFNAASKWRQEAREDFNFYNGLQWSDEVIAQLKEQSRPVMTFNRIAPLVNAVVGAERNNKRQVQFVPRKIGVAKPCDILTGAAEWFRQVSFAEYADSDAFKNCIICGMGWTDTRLSFDNNPNGDPFVRNLDPFKMLWDCNATQMNLADAKRLWYVDRRTLDEAKELFPNVDVADLHASWAQDSSYLTESRGYEESESHFDIENNVKMVTLVEARWIEREKYYKVADENSNDFIDITASEFEKLKNVYEGPINVIQCERDVTKRAYLGKKLLSEPDTPLVPRGQLGWECITGYFNEKDRQFYGIVRATKDPQRWANKYFSQVMHILNSQSKGGIMAERGAFDDEFEATQSWAKSDTITFLKTGAISGNRIQPKPAASFPAGFFTLFNEAKEAIAQVTGLSPEFIGTREVNQAGVLEAQRRQSSLNLLASLFDALRLYRHRQGKIILYLLQHYLSDGRIIRITGDDTIRYQPMVREDIVDVEYDIIVDDAPTSPNEKERTFGIVTQLLPMLQNFITPDILFDLLKYSPLPVSLIDRIQEKVQQQQMMAQQQNMEMPMPEPSVNPQVSPENIVPNTIIG